MMKPTPQTHSNAAQYGSRAGVTGTRLVLALALSASACATKSPPAQTVEPDRALMQTVLEQNPTGEPQLVFLLMGRYTAANQAAEGLAFFESQLERHALEPSMRALYLSVCGALRAQTAGEISLVRRAGWVKRAIAELDEAVETTDGELYIVRWLRAVVLAQLPPMFDREAMALEELRWAEAHIDEAPAPGLLRELLFQQARMLDASGDETGSRELLARSGYPSLDRAKALNTTFKLDPDTGFAFSAPQVVERVPDRVFEVRSHDFMEFYFVVSADRSSTIAIDAGSGNAAAQRAVEALRGAEPDLPPITDVLVTHAHWDHVGGHGYFRSLPSKPTFHANARWREQLDRQEGSGGPYERWWGSQFVLEDVLSFRPDHEFASDESMVVGETTVQMLPITGGETMDAALYHFPAEGVVFAGDMIMPYLGAPHADEGNPIGLVEALGRVEELRPTQVLHGHHGINRLFPDPQALQRIREPLRWLVARTEELLADAVPRAEIQHRNLIPPGLIEDPQGVAVPYLVLRSHVIDRLADIRRGYWQEPFAGADTLTATELGSVLTHYAGINRREATKMLETMVKAGDYELALQTAQWLRAQFPGSEELARLEQQAQLGLIDRYQTTDAFKFIWYGAAAGVTLRPVERHR